MRVLYRHLTENQFNHIFHPFNVRGGGLSDISFYEPRGGGIFGVVGNLVRRVLPIIKSLLVPEFGSFANNFSNDYMQNNNFRESVKSNLIKSGKNIGRRVIGGSRKVKSTKKN